MAILAPSGGFSSTVWEYLFICSTRKPHSITVPGPSTPDVLAHATKNNETKKNVILPHLIHYPPLYILGYHE